MDYRPLIIRSDFKFAATPVKCLADATTPSWDWGYAVFIAVIVFCGLLMGAIILWHKEFDRHPKLRWIPRNFFLLCFIFLLLKWPLSVVPLVLSTGIGLLFVALYKLVWGLSGYVRRIRTRKTNRESEK
jgi:hypothetical protein